MSRPPPAAPESKAALLAVLAVDGVPELNAAEFAVLVVEGPPGLVEVVPMVWVCPEPEPLFLITVVFSLPYLLPSQKRTD